MSEFVASLGINTHQLQVFLRTIYLKLKISALSITFNPSIAFVYRKLIASLIITTFINLVIITILRLLGNYLTSETFLPQLAAVNSNLTDPVKLHRFVKIGLYFIFFFYTFFTDFHRKTIGNIVLFFGTLFYFFYFGLIFVNFLRNLPKEIKLIQNYPQPQHSNINYFQYYAYCNNKNKSLLYICQPSLLCRSQYYDCLYGCQTRCVPKVNNPLIPEPGRFKVVQYN